MGEVVCVSRVYVGAEGAHDQGPTQGELWEIGRGVAPGAGVAVLAWTCGGGGVEDVEGIRVSCVRGANQAPYLIYTGQSDLTRAAYRYFSAPRLPAQTFE